MAKQVLSSAKVQEGFAELLQESGYAGFAKQRGNQEELRLAVIARFLRSTVPMGSPQILQ